MNSVNRERLYDVLCFMEERIKVYMEDGTNHREAQALAALDVHDKFCRTCPRASICDEQGLYEFCGKS